MDRPASFDDAPFKPPRAKWIALGVCVALFGLAFALWARFGAAVFVDALGAVVSCF